MIPNHKHIKELLDRKYFEFNRLEFIPEDPVSIPHRFCLKEDVEIAGFLAATLSWGQRKTIIQSATRLMEWMDDSPYDFILHHTEKDLQRFTLFRHRTFNGEDCRFFLRSLKTIYREEGGLEAAFNPGTDASMKEGIIRFRKIFLSTPHESRSEKHVADPGRGSSAKRINMFLRWMVRKDSSGVDFGLWRSIRPSQLYCPLDVHTGNVARKIGILSAKQDNWRAVEELTSYLRQLDPEDPVRYDFALFGIGRYDKNNT